MKMKQKANFEGRAFGSLCINDSSLAKAQTTIFKLEFIKFTFLTVPNSETKFSKMFWLIYEISTYLCLFNFYSVP